MDGASAGSATEEKNFFEVLEVNTPSFRFSECHPSKRGELYVLRFIEQLECHPSKRGELYVFRFIEQLECHPSERGELRVCYFALTLMIWWRSVV